MKDFVEDTLQDGTEVLGEIQEDVEKEVLSKTSEHFDKISEKMENTFNDLHGLVEKNDEICEDNQIFSAGFTDNFYSQGRTTTSPRPNRRSWTRS